jgi:Flp pilus assembly pilin Flp
LAEHVLLVAVILVGLVGILFGMQSHLRQIYTKANNEMGVADCGGSCSAASSGGSAGGASGGSGGSSAGSSGGSGSGGGGIVLGVGDETPTNGPDASAGSGGGSGGSATQPGIHVPTR